MNDQQFDQLLRNRHAQAVSKVSLRTQARLRQRLHPAANPAAPDRRPAWLLAAACAAVLVFVSSAYWRQDPPATSPAPAPVVDANDNGALVATLDETPDLYLWLASDDADALASE